MTLLTDDELGELRTVAEMGMTADVLIYRRQAIAPASSGDDYGDDDIEFDATAETLVRGVKGWLHSEPTPVQETDTGSIVTANTYRLYVPVGTDIRPGDRVVIGTRDFTVSDTTGESTWQALLTVSLRGRE